MFAPAAAEGLKGQVQAVEQFIVAAQHCQAAGAQVVENLALGPQGPLTGAAQVFNVGVADVGDHGDGGLH